MGSNQSDVAIAEASHGFALSLLRTHPEGGNVCFSPHSLFSALCMLRIGAGGDTGSEIAEALGIGGVSENDLKSFFGRLLSSHDHHLLSSYTYTLDCANAAVLRQKYPVKDSYKDVLKSFRLKLFKEDPQERVESINKWVETKTRGKISGLLDSLDPRADLVLLNAVYFKGTWKQEFRKGKTSKEVFYSAGGQSNWKRVDMMYQKKDFYLAHLESYSALQLPYRGGAVAMLILLPIRNRECQKSLEELEKELTAGFLRDVKKRLEKRKVLVTLPIFRIEYSSSLRETLQDLGMRSVFESGADLYGMSDRIGLSLSDVVHRAVVEVDEKGSVAANGKELVEENYGKHPEIFTADRPFLFAIYDTKTDSNLLTGRIVRIEGEEYEDTPPPSEVESRLPGRGVARSGDGRNSAASKDHADLNTF